MDVEFHNQEWGGMWKHCTVQATETMFLSFVLRNALGWLWGATAERHVVGKPAVLYVTRYISTDIDQNRHNRSTETQRFGFLQRLCFRVLWSPGVTPPGLAGHRKMTWVVAQRVSVWIYILFLEIKTYLTGGVCNCTWERLMRRLTWTLFARREGNTHDGESLTWRQI